MPTKLTTEEAQEQYWSKYRDAISTFYKRRDAEVMRMAKTYFADIKKSRLSAAMAKTMRIKGLTRSGRLKLAHSPEYAGYSTEEYPVFDRNLSIPDLYDYFDDFGDRATLDDFIRLAELKVNAPAILDKEPPFCSEPEESFVYIKPLQLAIKNRPPPKFTVKG